MNRNVPAKIRAIVIRALAVVAVLATYAVGSIGAQVATTVGLSAVALTRSATPARAGWRRDQGWWRRSPGWWGWGWRRGWRRCWWGDWC
ncbi:MAG TPA: hypothetical protein VGX95_11995 [Xanthobacteraceae bacterium]|jgi:hypothetical protein|nr:hypothetical protein [Xanthobacteraceae bacterium]